MLRALKLKRFVRRPHSWHRDRNVVHVDYRLDFPNRVEYSGPRPLVFVVPNPSFHAGNLGPLIRAFVKNGMAVFRFIDSLQIDLKRVLQLYSEVTSDLRVDRSQVILLGQAEGADQIARRYYDFYKIQPPMVAILLSTEAQLIHLNNFTCPYFLVHGELDPILNSVPYQSFKAAIFHHQMRYGDGSTHRLFPHLGRDLGEKTISSDVVDQILDWLGPVGRIKAA